MVRDQFILPIDDEIIVDNFAGGGGASAGIESALGRHVDIAINHDPLAVALHSANHPQTHHHCEDVWKVDPVAATKGRRVGLAWFSPDCCHFSKAKGGKPRSKKIRGLAWVIIKWITRLKNAGQKPPRVIMLENVEEFQDWGPLLPNGHPCPKRKGRTFKQFVGRLRSLGYEVDYRELRACDYGAPTIRKRLFLIARCDGQPIVWPAATHGDPNAYGFTGSGLKPWRTAAECIDWSLPCPSIFLTREEGRAIGVKRPLAPATMRRLARGVVKFVINAKEPLIVQYHSPKRPGDDRISSSRRPLGTQTTARRFGLGVPFVAPLTHQGSDRVESATEPFRTITGAHRGEKAVAVPFLAGAGGPVYGGKPKAVNAPLNTMVTENHTAVVQPFIAGVGGRMGQSPERPTTKPMQTLTAKADSVLVTPFIQQSGHYKSNSHMVKSAGEPLRTQTSRAEHSLVLPLISDANRPQSCKNNSAGEPMRTQLAEVKGGHFQLVQAFLATVTGQGRKFAQVQAFLQKYYGEGGQDQQVKDPLHTIPTKSRFGLVTVHGQQYQISDIGMRMLIARELYRGQGFPESYIIQIEVWVRRGKKKKLTLVPLSQEAQIRMCGNSVCPPLASAIVHANVPEMARWVNGERKEFNKHLEFLRRNAPGILTVDKARA